MNIEFNLPRKSSKKNKDLFPGEKVVTMSKQPAGKDSGKFTLNETAITTLGFEKTGSEQVTIGFSGTEMYIANADKFNAPRGIRLAKNGSFTSKVYYQYIRDFLNIDTSEDTHFNLGVGVDYEGTTAYLLEKKRSHEVPASESIPSFSEVVKRIEEVDEEVQDIVNDDFEYEDIPDIL